MPQHKRVDQRKPKAQPAQSQSATGASGERSHGGIYTCPPIIRDVQAVSDAELKRWAVAILDLIAAGVINYSWATLARMLDERKIIAVKLATQQQSLGLLHACGRIGADVLQRKFSEATEDGGEERTVYCVVRADSVDRLPLGGVYGAGTTGARKLLRDGVVEIVGEQLARRTAMATRKLIPAEHPGVYKQFSGENRGSGARRRRVLFVEKNENGRYTLRLADRLRELLAKRQK